MFTSNHNKILVAVLGLIVFSSSCRFFQREKPLDVQIDLPKQTAPFSTKEPEIFQVEIVVSTFIGGTRSEKKYFVAKKGGATIYRFNYGDKDETAILEKADGKRYLLDKSAKTYRETTGNGGSAETGELQHFLTTKWLNEKKAAKFEDLGLEKDLKKYRVTIDDKGGSEILVFFDEKLKIPVKQEFYSITGQKKTLFYSAELKNAKTEVDAKLFEVPAGYRSIEEPESLTEKP